MIFNMALQTLLWFAMKFEYISLITFLEIMLCWSIRELWMEWISTPSSMNKTIGQHVNVYWNCALRFLHILLKIFRAYLKLRMLFSIFNLGGADSKKFRNEKVEIDGKDAFIQVRSLKMQRFLANTLNQPSILIVFSIFVRALLMFSDYWPDIVRMRFAGCGMTQIHHSDTLFPFLISWPRQTVKHWNR